jgi:outer membrane protein assembly factor BamD (BamD/ComL family)
MATAPYVEFALLPPGWAQLALRLAQVISFALLLAVAGCQDKAAQLLDVAQFEELQNNPQHARELYEEIVRDYPKSEQAKTARERLSKLAAPQ